MKRRAEYLLEGKHTIDGAGVKLYRVFGGPSTVNITDPFLLLDFFGSDNISDYINGFPWHPHRGIETVTYQIEGMTEHEDSEGNKGVIHKGDLQWMTAGSGIFHQEMPKPVGENTEVRGFQLWINLPASDKMTYPVYRDIKGDSATEKDHWGEFRVIAGEFMGVEGPVRAGKKVDPIYIDMRINPESEITFNPGQSRNVLVYVMEGHMTIEDSPRIEEGQLVVTSEGDELSIKAGKRGTRIIVLGGKPLREPVAWYGPIVMNSDEEIQTALRELRQGNFVKEKRPIRE
jgi:redox-sensitive bicupin YhaK (pirin superfamily)